MLEDERAGVPGDSPGEARGPGVVMVGHPERFINRELSWVAFNERVLELARDETIPLLERVKFLAIFADNLDEFYMVRVAGLDRQQAARLSTRSPDGLTPSEQLDRIARAVRPLVETHAASWCDSVMPELRANGVRILRWSELQNGQRKELDVCFAEQIFPVVTPLAVGPGHPFPYISNLSLNLAVLLKDPSSETTHFARIKVPPLLDRFIAIEEDGCFVPIEDVIAANLDQLFPGMEVIEHHAFKVTRNADLEVNDDGAEDLLEALEAELRRRRFTPTVRLEVEAGMSTYVLELLKRELEVADRDVHTLEGPLNLSDLWEIHALDRPELKGVPFRPSTPAAFATAEEEAETDVFEVLRERDVLVHHPYESFSASVQRFIEQAAVDPHVLAIKQTLYRTSGDSPVVDALIEAAQVGKQVVVLVEIKARFDERNNINWARTLEQAGCHVVYGLVGLKTHCKLCLIVRQEEGRLRRYVHVGTGNYNPKTARIYEDIGFFTADPQLSADVGNLFNLLTGHSKRATYRTLIVSPHDTRDRIVEMIERETDQSSEGSPGHIMIKVNSLVDESVIDALYRASRSHVRIDLIVRGICSLRPGVPGLSENITVRSIIGRFLEHSRIFMFHNDGEEELYIGSADVMHRNLDRRVETMVAVRSADIKQRLKLILELCRKDNTMAWVLDGRGDWKRSSPSGQRPVGLQAELMRLARSDA